MTVSINMTTLAEASEVDEVDTADPVEDEEDAEVEDEVEVDVDDDCDDVVVVDNGADPEVEVPDVPDVQVAI